MKIKKSEAYQLALQAGFMLSSEYGQEADKLMPVTDGETLMKLICLLEKKLKEI